MQHKLYSVHAALELIRECEEYLSDNHKQGGKSAIAINTISTNSQLHNKMKEVLTTNGEVIPVVEDDFNKKHEKEIQAIKDEVVEMQQSARPATEPNEADKWIEVTPLLPIDNLNVLVAIKYETIPITAYRNGDVWYISSETISFCDSSAHINRRIDKQHSDLITHYMTLPKVPIQ